MNIWHRPRTVEHKPRRLKQIPPVAIGTIFTVLTITVGKKSKKLLFTSAPIVTIAPTPERKERKRKQNAKDQAAWRGRQDKVETKAYNKKYKNRKKEPDPLV